jgi:membrane-bound ClpP family serine protease
VEKRIKYEMNIIQIAFGILSVMGILPGIMMGMIFDAPGSEKEIFRWMIFISYPCFVLTFILTAIFSRIFYRFKKYKIARWLNVIPAFWILWAFCWFFYWNSQ